MHSEQGPAPLPTSRPIDEPLISEFADDEDIIDLVEEFVGTLPSRIEAIQQALEQDDVDMLTSLAHQLKGAGGGFGFTPITDAARQLEKAARSGTALDGLREPIDQLVALCRRARATST